MRDVSSECYYSRRSPVLSQSGMVATSQPLASNAGAAVLRKGGTAADAAVAAAAALQVTQPCSTGLGGDAFFIYYDAESRQVSALNGSGRSPAALDLSRLDRDGCADGIPPFHPHTVTVPGAPRAWQDLLDRFGVLDREQVIAPARSLAARGFPVSPLTAGWWSRGAEIQLSQARHGAELMIDGRGPRPGEVMQNPTLARSLGEFAEFGADPFYTGRIADEIVAVLRDGGGVLSKEDLASHRSEWVEPIEIDYRGTRILECPPNGQGLAALVGLNVLRSFDPAESNLDATMWYHRMIESMRVGFADAHRYVADPAFAEVPIGHLLSAEYGIERAGTISETARLHHVAPWEPVGDDTVYFCVVDAAGNACSFINSNYQGFGTGIVPKGCGFTLQNRGKGFRLEPGHPNCLEPRKRPYHTIIPGMALHPDGTLLAPFGVMGGFMQPQGHLQVIQALVDAAMDPQAALDRPRFQLAGGDSNGAVMFESESDYKVARGLEARGHRIDAVGGRGRYVFGLGQIIVRDEHGVLWGGSDPRGDGCALPVC